MKVKDHDYITEEYQGPAHQEYHPNLSPRWKFAVVFHNLQSYHSHLICQEINKRNYKINVILK